MTVEQLLIPRIELTNYYPGCPFKKGDILTFDETRYQEHPGMATTRYVYKCEAELSTANFETLPWWKYRTIDCMPEYLIVTAKTVNGHEWKGVCIKCGVNEFWNDAKFTCQKKFVSAYGGILISCFAPCSQSDYIAYKSKNPD